MKVQVAVACVPYRKGDRDANFAAAETMIQQFPKAGAQIVVLPEEGQGYPIENGNFTVEQARQIAEPFGGCYVRLSAKQRESPACI